MSKTQPINIKDYDEELLSKFLTLIKEKYRMVDKANFFLEQSGISSINIAIANQRDAVSHFVSFLKETDPKISFEQLAAAEEHLRRAMVEPYQVSLDIVKSKIYENYDFLKRHSFDESEIKKITKEIKEINKLYNMGREAKNGNKWDAKLEEGVNNFIDGFNRAEILLDELEIKVSRVKNDIEKNKQTIKYSLAGLGLFLLGILLGYII